MRIKWILLTAIFLAASITLFYPQAVASANPVAAAKILQVTLGDMMTVPLQYNLALGMYDSALQAAPGDPWVLQKKEGVLSKIGDIKGAVEANRRILESDPCNTAALVRQGDLIARQGDLNGALSYYEAANALDPDDADVLVREGDIFLALSIQEQQKLHDAAHDLSRPLDMSDYPVGQMNLTISTEYYRTAVEYYERAIRINPILSVGVSARVLAMAEEQMNMSEQILKEIQRRS